MNQVLTGLCTGYLAIGPLSQVVSFRYLDSREPSKTLEKSAEGWRTRIASSTGLTKTSQRQWPGTPVSLFVEIAGIRCTKCPVQQRDH